MRIGREQLQPYETVELREAEVTDARSTGDKFEITIDSGDPVYSRKLLLATGVVDDVPKLEGIEEFYGTTVFHCPYCDGWELRDQPLAIYGRGENGVGLALELLLWSRDLVLCTDGPAEIEAEDRQRLAQHNISVREEKIARLEGVEEKLERIVFAGGETLAGQRNVFQHRTTAGFRPGKKAWVRFYRSGLRQHR